MSLMIVSPFKMFGFESNDVTKVSFNSNFTPFVLIIIMGMFKQNVNHVLILFLGQKEEAQTDR